MAEEARALEHVVGSPIGRPVGACLDLFGETRRLGVSVLEFKVAGLGPDGLFVVESRFEERGGPARHLHRGQDVWLCALEGEFVMEVGGERSRLQAGDSVLAPREVPHVWAFARGRVGRILQVYSPAGKMEAFFREIAKGREIAPQDPTLWRDYGMELLGPPLPFADLSEAPVLRCVPREDDASQASCSERSDR